MLRQVVVIVIGAMALATVITFLFGGDDATAPELTVEWISGDGSRTPTAPQALGTAITVPVATATPRLTPGSIRGFAFPIAGACLPTSPSLLPGAPREYRLAIHEGLDFYEFDSCTAITFGTSVLAAKAGVVKRADVAYQDLTESALIEIEALVVESGGSSPAAADSFRGRQVWIEHQDGTVARYAHLSGIAPGITSGSIVSQGDEIGFVGESGTPESVREPGTQYHLHFEIRVGGSFLGQGLGPEAARQTYAAAFSQSDD